MKVCIQIDSSFDDFLNKVGQMNNASCGKVCRLIIEHQLTFYLSRGTIPMFYRGVFADFKKMDLSGFNKSDEDVNILSNIDREKNAVADLKNDDLLIPEGFLLKDYLGLCHVSSYEELNDEQKKEYDDYIMSQGKYFCRKALRK